MVVVHLAAFSGASYSPPPLLLLTMSSLLGRWRHVTLMTNPLKGGGGGSTAAVGRVRRRLPETARYRSRVEPVVVVVFVVFDDAKGCGWPLLGRRVRVRVGFARSLSGRKRSQIRSDHFESR